VTDIAQRVATRFLAREEEPVYNRKKDRVVYVLPETLKQKSDTYEKIPDDEKDHVEDKGKPEKPVKPRPPRKPHKPELPRAEAPAPLKPAMPPHPAELAKPVKPIKPIPPVKPPTPPEHPRRWKVKKPEVYHHNE
jgi:hypothetical protein